MSLRRLQKVENTCAPLPRQNATTPCSAMTRCTTCTHTDGTTTMTGSPQAGLSTEDTVAPLAAAAGRVRAVASPGELGMAPLPVCSRIFTLSRGAIAVFETYHTT